MTPATPRTASGGWPVQLDEVVARAVELSLLGPELARLPPSGTDVDSLVGELESLRVALEETSG